MNTLRHIVTGNVTAERKHLPKLNILSYHGILFLFLSLFGAKRLIKATAILPSLQNQMSEDA